jgi:hypothetical protein
MKTMMMQGMTCGMVSNASAASCTAKGCTYKSGDSYNDGGSGATYGEPDVYKLNAQCTS